MRYIYTIIVGLLLLGSFVDASTAPFFNPFDVNNPQDPDDAYAVQLQPPPKWVIKGLNLRDAGGWTIPGKGTVPYGMVYRSMGLNSLQEESPELLEEDQETIKALGLKTIIDYRIPDVVEVLPNDPAAVPGVTQHNIVIDFNTTAAEYVQLNAELLPAYEALDDEQKQLVVMGEHPDPKFANYYGPDGVYIDLLNKHKEAYLEVLNIVAEPDNHPVLYHCFFGKDRTGVTSALILTILGVSEDEIVEDFMLSNEGLNSIAGHETEWVEEQDMRALLQWLSKVENLIDIIGINRNILVKLESTFAPKGVLVPRGATWKYNDFGPTLLADPNYSQFAGLEDGTWKQLDFFDLPWKSGTAMLGFSSKVDDISTTLKCVDNAVNTPCDLESEKGATKIPVYYFRHEFQIEEGLRPEAMALSARVDDSAVIYINGREALRINLPEDFDPETGTFSNLTAFTDEFEVYYLNADLLVEGANVIAVQYHQKDAVNDDMLLDLELGRVSGIKVEGIITGPSGLPVPQLPVLLSDNTEGRPANTYELQTDSGGKIELTLAPGEYSLTVNDERFEGPATTSFKLTAGQSGTDMALSLDWKEGRDSYIAINEQSGWKYWPASLEQILVDPFPDGWNAPAFVDASWSENKHVVRSDVNDATSFQLPLAPAIVVRDADNGVMLKTGVPKRMLFRKRFNLEQVDNIEALTIGHTIDDGAVFYLNGVEVGRFNMIEGPVGQSSLPVKKTEAAVKENLTLTGTALTHLVQGENVLAVEVFGYPNMTNIFSYIGEGCSQNAENPALYDGCDLSVDDSIASVAFNIGAFAETFLVPGEEKFEELEQKVAFSGDLYFDLSLSVTLSSPSPMVQVVGSTVDISKKPVPGVRVQVESSDMFAYTDSNGRFNLPSAVGSRTLLIGIPDDPYGRNFRYRIEVPPAGRSDVSVTLLSDDQRPVYETVRVEDPQIIAAGMSPSIIQSTEASVPVSLVAVVRPGDRALSGVSAKIGGRVQAMERVGSLGNGDEIWALEISMDRGENKIIFAEDEVEWIMAKDDLDQKSPEFPLYRYSNRNPLDADEDSLELPFCGLDSDVAKRPQLIACGQSPAIVSTDDSSVKIIAIVRAGENPLGDVLLEWDDCALCTTPMDPVGRLTNGDYIYEGGFSVPAGFNNEERTMLEDGWSVKAFDNKEEDSNACFHVEWAQ